MAHQQLGFRFENDWPLEHMEYISKNYKAGVTIPVNVTIENEQHVLSMENVKQILSRAHTISLMDCYCRLTFAHCDAPVNVCLDLNEVAEQHIAEFGARKISFDEALEVLERTHESGLVHMAYGHGDLYEPGVINSVCSCCTCCCGVLSGVLRFGLFPHLLTAHAIAVTDPSACIDCGDCIFRCQFGARDMANGTLSFNPRLCFGCGLCVSTCPTDAITLAEK
ncbi:MAG: 4Fe-4S binding protein [Candidatus Promineifilaceae bacterium]|nr:4Fe-4S binding protein [Candidatus Promineifilaceae bacterium]